MNKSCDLFTNVSLPHSHKYNFSLTKYLGWLSVKQDLNDPPDDPARRVAYYVEKEPNPKLKGNFLGFFPTANLKINFADFVPFDLEAFCQQQRIKREKMQQQQQPPPPQ